MPEPVHAGLPKAPPSRQSLPVPPDDIEAGVTLGAGQPREDRVRHELNILALIKGEHSYVFVYDDDSRQALIDLVKQQAANPDLNLSWFDAAVLTEKAWEQAIAAEEAETEFEAESAPTSHRF